MVDRIDARGLEAVADDLKRGSRDLETLLYEGSSELARLGYWADRSRFEQLMGDQSVAITRLADDLVVRASGASNAESAILALIQTNGIRDPYIRRPRTRFGRGPDPEREQNIAAALDEIASLLETNGLNLLFMSLGDTDVSREEAAKIGMILVQLTPSELAGVLVRLDRGLLEKWLKAVEEEGLSGQMKPVFEYAAINASPSVLSDMVLASEGTVQDALIAAIGTAATDRAQAWAFRYVANVIGDDPDNAQAGVDLLAAMSPPLREAALVSFKARGLLGDFVNGLVADEITSMIEDLPWWAPKTEGMAYLYTETYSAAPLIAFLDLVEPIDDADLKAQVFVDAVDALSGPLELSSHVMISGALGITQTTHVFEDNSGNAALGALAALILTDPVGVVDELNLDADEDGRATSDFFRELLREEGSRARIEGEPLSDEGAVLTNQVVAALLGDGLDSSSRAEFFGAREMTPDGTLDYVNSERLGFVLGSVSVALDDLGAGDEESWDAVGIILGAVGLADRTKTTAAISFVASTFDEITRELERRKLAELKLEYDSFQEALLFEVIPRTPGGNRYNGDPVDEYERKFLWVRDQAG